MCMKSALLYDALLLIFINDFTLAKQALDIQLADDMAKNRTKSDEKIVIIKNCQRLLSIMEKEKDMLSMKDLAINGHDLIQAWL